MTGDLEIWIEPGLAEHWLPHPGDGYTVEYRGKYLHSIVKRTWPADGGLRMHLEITGEYTDCQYEAIASQHDRLRRRVAAPGGGAH